MIRLLPFILLFVAWPAAARDPAPLFRDFVGLCGHTVSFKPEQNCRLQNEVVANACIGSRSTCPQAWPIIAHRNTGMIACGG